MRDVSTTDPSRHPLAMPAVAWGRARTVAFFAGIGAAVVLVGLPLAQAFGFFRGAPVPVPVAAAAVATAIATAWLYPLLYGARAEHRTALAVALGVVLVWLAHILFSVLYTAGHSIASGMTTYDGADRLVWLTRDRLLAGAVTALLLSPVGALAGAVYARRPSTPSAPRDA